MEWESLSYKFNAFLTCLYFYSFKIYLFFILYVKKYLLKIITYFKNLKFLNFTKNVTNYTNYPHKNALNPHHLPIFNKRVRNLLLLERFRRRLHIQMMIQIRIITAIRHATTRATMIKGASDQSLCHQAKWPVKERNYFQYAFFFPLSLLLPLNSTLVISEFSARTTLFLPFFFSLLLLLLLPLFLPLNLLHTVSSEIVYI